MKFRNLIAMILALSLLLCVTLPVAATPPAPSYFYHVGDMDRDMRITTNDVTLILQVAVGRRELTPVYKICADIDRDGKVNSTDARKLLQYTVGKYTGRNADNVMSAFLLDENDHAKWIHIYD